MKERSIILSGPMVLGLLIGVAVVLASCDDTGPPPAKMQQATTQPDRFAVERVSTVSLLMTIITDGGATRQKNTNHEIFIVTDANTGIRYIGLEGVGLCRLENGIVQPEVKP